MDEKWGPSSTWKYSTHLVCIPANKVTGPHWKGDICINAWIHVSTDLDNQDNITHSAGPLGQEYSLNNQDNIFE